MRPDYFEGILQLRNPNEKVLDFVHHSIKNRKDVQVAKTSKSPNGIDIYLSSQKYLIIIGRKLQENFGGEINITRRIHTRSRSTSKDIYRVTVLFRLPYFKKGDIITHRGKKLLILNLGRKVFCRDLETGRKITLRYDKLREL